MHGRDPETLLREVTWLRHLARRLVADDASADDLAGDTLAAFCTAPAPPRNRRGWLATVLRHRAARQHRRELLRQRAEQAAARDERLPALDDTLAKAQLHRAVVDAVLGLDEPYRSAVLLRHLDELPLHEVAARLQVPSETARTRIKRGLEQLRRRLDQRYGDRAAWAALLLPWRPSPTPLPLLGLLMTTKLTLTAVAVAAAAVVYLLLPREAQPMPPPSPVAAAPQPATVAAEPQPAPQRQLAAAPAAPPAAAEATAPMIVVRGRTVDEATSLPLAGVTVGWFGGEGAPPTTTTSDRDGRFALRTAPLPPMQRGVLLLREREHALCTKDLGSPVDARTPDEFDVGDVTMPPGTALEGSVVDSSGAPAPGAELFAMLFSYYTSAGRLVSLEEALPVGRSDEAGGFRLDDRLLPNQPAPLLLAASALGVGYCDLDELHRERSSARADIRLLPATTLRVRIVDEHGAAVAGALIVAEPRFVPLGMPGTYPLHVERVAGLAEYFTAHSGDDGAAALQPLAILAGRPTPYTLRVEAAGRDPSVVTVQLPQQDSIDIVCALSRPLLLQGHVRDGAGRPIAAARVRAHWGDDVAAQSGDDGALSLSLRRGTGPLSVEIEADGWSPQRRELQPETAAETAALDFVLQPAATLQGRVIDQRGEPVVGAMIWLAGGDDDGTPSAADGSFRMPMLPGAVHLLQVSPPEPQSSWRGRVEHVLAPGQDSVTLVLTRLPRDRSQLEVEIVDAAGKPLEAARVMLVRDEDSLGLWHPATAVIGHVTAGGLAPGEWSLRIDPTRGCELLSHFTVPPGGEAVQLQLVQPTGASAHGEVVPDAGAGELPAHVDLHFGEGDQRARFVAAAGQELLADGRMLRLDPRRGLGFAVVDVDPSRPLSITADGGELRGAVTANLTPGGDAMLRLPLRAAAKLRLCSQQPFAGDRLLLQLRRPGGPWGEPMRCEGLHGRTVLIDLPITAGDLEWRVRLPSAGADNRSAAHWQSGACTPAPGGIAIADVVEPH